MFKSGELEAVSMALEPQFAALEERIMTDIVRRIKINGEITRAADWQITRLAQLGQSKKAIKEAIRDTLKLSDKEVDSLYSDIIKKGYERDEKLYKAEGKEQIPFEDNNELQQLIGAVTDQTKGELKSITQSLGFAAKGADGKVKFSPVGEYYTNILDNAMLDIASGSFDYNTVLKRTVKEMTNSGLRTVDYESGWSNRVEVAARRAVMTGMSQLTAKANESNAEQLGTDTFEVTAHGGARPEHQEWQGKWYTKDELESICGLGEVTGLCGANCYHDYYPVIPGISEPTYTPEELEAFNAKENTPIEYNGKKYTKYEATQRQRKLETTMRAQRQEIKLLKEGGASEDDLIAARARYRGTSAEYARFSKAMDIPQQRERVTIDGLGNIGQGKYTLDKSEKKSIIESVSKQQDFMDRAHKEQLSQYVYDPKTGKRKLEEWTLRSNPLGGYSNISSETYSKDARAMAEYLNEKVNNGDYGKVDRIVIAKNENLRGISSYRQFDNTLFISEELITKEGFDKIVDKSYFPARNLDDVITHELDGHKRHWDMVKKFYNANLDRYLSLEDAKQDYERSLREFVVKQQVSDSLYISKAISNNAYERFKEKGLLNELIADGAVLHKQGNIKEDLLFSKILEVLKYDG